MILGNGLSESHTEIISTLHKESLTYAEYSWFESLTYAEYSWFESHDLLTDYFVSAWIRMRNEVDAESLFEELLYWSGARVYSVQELLRDLEDVMKDVERVFADEEFFRGLEEEFFRVLEGKPSQPSQPLEDKSYEKLSSSEKKKKYLHKIASTPCIRGNACEILKCGFLHPEGHTVSYSAAVAAAINKKRRKKLMAKTPCKKGRGCRVHRCGFNHE